MSIRPKLHLGIIPDGSRRWGRAHLKPAKWNGSESEHKVEELLLHISDNHPDVDEVTIWAMSTENMERNDADRRKVYRIVERLLTRTDTFMRAKACMCFVGTRSQTLPASLRQAIDEITRLTGNNDRLRVNVGLGYGGKEEILAAAGALLERRRDSACDTPVTAEEFEQGLMLPRPLDLVVRTGGEQRLSGFMLYQIEYAELFFSQTLWPDFSVAEFDEIMRNYRQRDRRYGR